MFSHTVLANDLTDNGTPFKCTPTDTSLLLWLTSDGDITVNERYLYNTFLKYLLSHLIQPMTSSSGLSKPAICSFVYIYSSGGDNGNANAPLCIEHDLMNLKGRTEINLILL